MDQLIEELKKQIIESLKLEDVSPADIDPAEPLFGGGLSLDSIDALDLIVMIEKHYGIQIENIEIGREAMESVNNMAEFITQHKKQDA